MADCDWKLYWIEHKEARQATNRKAYLKHREERLERQRQYRINNKEKCQAAVNKWNENNKEKKKQWHANYQKEKLKDPYYRLYKNVQRRMLLAMKSKSAKTNELIGCTPKFLIEWLEAKFIEGMCWENYGKVWHVDHKKPMALFDLTDPSQQKEACNYKNLQPLFAKDNIAKGKRYIEGA